MYDDHDCDDDHDIDDEDYDYGLVLGHASLETSLVTSRQLVIDNDLRDDKWRNHDGNADNNGNDDHTFNTSLVEISKSGIIGSSTWLV